MMTRARLLLVLCATLLLAGCGVRFAYSQLDWLVPWYLRDYVSFNVGQRSLLDQRLAARLDWHCRTHVPEYVGALREARSLLQRERVAASDLAPFLWQGEAWWDALRTELVDDAAVLLAGLSDEQVAELATAFARRDREARKEFLDGDDETRRAAQIARMEKRLRGWFGRLSPEQRSLVAAWSDALQPTTAQWLDNRRQWQQGVLEALAVRQDAAQFASRMATLRAPLDAGAPAAHRAQVAHNRQLTLQLLAEVFNAASPEQRERLLAEVDDLIAQFDTLACAPLQTAEAH